MRTVVENSIEIRYNPTKRIKSDILVATNSMSHLFIFENGPFRSKNTLLFLLLFLENISNFLQTCVTKGSSPYLKKYVYWYCQYFGISLCTMHRAVLDPPLPYTVHILYGYGYGPQYGTAVDL